MANAPIDAARDFVQTSVQIAAMNSELPLAIKNKVKHSDIWLNKFRRVGDLLAYLKRFRAENDDPIYREMKKYGLKTFEDIVPDFESRFAPWANDRTRCSDFVIGEEYSPHDILIYSNTYDTRAGGMFVIEADGKPSSVVIKATLKGGQYANEWIETDQTLKYFLKSKDGNFGEDYKPNRAILTNPGIPIVTFVRETSADQFVFKGVFEFKEIVREKDGSKYFILRRAVVDRREISESADYFMNSFAKKLEVARLSSREERLARLAIAPKKPKTTTVVSKAYERNPDVVVAVLERANGKCEACENFAPFARKSDGSPYLEVHHRILLSEDGDDTVENAIALCPNCHREKHYGI
jgi:5-methylcytosine-specific restriction protein A